MEEVFSRFSHLSEEIFELLDNDDIITCMKVSKVWKIYLNSQKLVQVRRIKATVGQFHVVGKAWDEVFNTATTETMKGLALCVTQFYKKDPAKTYYAGLTPLHITAGTGQLKLYQIIQEKANEKQPKDSSGAVPFYYAAQNGHLKVYEVIAKNEENKNSSTSDGWTPLHGAAVNGHVEICKLLIQNLTSR